MKSDDQNDKTEDFLRKYLHEFEEEPPESTWEGVQRSLPPAVRPKYPRLTGLVALLLVGMLVQFLYFENKVNQLERHLSANKQALEPKSTPATSQPQLPPPAVPSPSPDTPRSIRPAKEIMLPDPVTPIPAGTRRGMGWPLQPSLQPSSTEGAPNDQASTPPAGLPAQSDLPSPAAVTATSTEAALTDKPNKAQLPPAAPRIETNGLAPLTSPRVELGLAASLPKRYRSRRLSVAALAMPLTTWQKVEVQEDRFPGPDSHRKHVKYDDPRNATGLRAGVAATWSIAPNWSLVAGILAKQTTLESTHRPKLEFQDGHSHGGHGGPGGPHNDSDFDFDYTVYGGGSESQVTLRVESNTPGGPSPDPHQPVRFSLTTEQRSRFLEMPLGLQYQRRIGVWQPFIRLGVLMEKFESQSITITRSTLEGNDFQFDPASPPKIQTKPYRQLSFSGWLAAGAQYGLTRRLSITGEAWLTQEAPDGSSTQSVSIQNGSFGLGLGLAYRF